MNMSSSSDDDLRFRIKRIVYGTPIVDIHTHLFPSSFRDLFLYGIEDLLTYHYLIEDFFCKRRDMKPEEFFRLDKKVQAKLVWDTLFVDNIPLSEACRGVITVLEILKLDGKEYEEIKEFFDKQKEHLGYYTALICALTKISHIFMTNDPFNEEENYFWNKGAELNYRFQPTLRLDALLDPSGSRLKEINSITGGFVKEDYVSIESPILIDRIIKYLDTYALYRDPKYIMLSLPYNIATNEYSNKVLKTLILPYARKRRLPIFLKLGTDRQVNPDFKLAGDSLGDVDMTWLRDICQNNLDIRFAVTVLSMNNQHALAVMCKKFPNLYIYGCWWYCNTPSQIESITKMRMELLGNSFTFQHSDARVMEHLIYKWEHSKEILVNILHEKYQDLEIKGFTIKDSMIKKDVRNLFGHDLLDFIEGK